MNNRTKIQKNHIRISYVIGIDYAVNTTAQGLLFEIVCEVRSTTCTSVSSPLLIPMSTPASSLHPAGIPLVSKDLLEYTNVY